MPSSRWAGMRVTPDLAYDVLDPAVFDALVIPGGLAWETEEAPDFTELVQVFHAAGKVVAGICAAASALAATGILNSVAHTGNSLASHKRQAAYRGEALYRDQPQAVSHAGRRYRAGQFARDLHDRDSQGARPLGSGGGSGDCRLLAGAPQLAATTAVSVDGRSCHPSPMIARWGGR
jgi:putative intracellular protease/amidase